jgi:subtilisin-like proprotein convertase family protein
MRGTMKPTLKNKTRTETQIKFYKAMAVSAGLYGSGNWALTQKDKNRIHAAEMRFLRVTLGVTIQDRVTNEASRKTLKVNNLNDNISKYRDNWFTTSHVWISVIFHVTCYHISLLEKETWADQGKDG